MSAVTLYFSSVTGSMQVRY